MKFTYNHNLIFIAICALFFINHELGWRAIGLIILIQSLEAFKKKRILIGIEGNLEDKGITLTGKTAVVLSLFSAIIGLSILINPNVLDTFFGLCEGSCTKTIR